MAQALRNARIVEIDGPFTVGSGKVRAQAYPIKDNPHATGMLLGYLPHARLGYETDLWSPGFGLPLPPPGTDSHANLLALVQSVAQWQLDPEYCAGGHGRAARYAPLRRALQPQ